MEEVKHMLTYDRGDYPGEMERLLAPQCLRGWALTFQKALKHMETHTLGLLIRALQL